MIYCNLKAHKSLSPLEWLSALSTYQQSVPDRGVDRGVANTRIVMFGPGLLTVHTCYDYSTTPLH